MASGLNIKRAAGYLAALVPLWGLALVRLWALLSGHIPGKVIAVLALAGAAAVLFFWAKFSLTQTLLRPFCNNYVNLIVGSLAFLTGGLLDTGYVMFGAAGTVVDKTLFHALSALGSGLVFAVIVLSVCAAARAFGKVEWGSPWQLAALFLLVNGLAAFYILGSATVYIWDNAGYWNVARNLASQPLGLAQLREVAATTVTLEYNYLLAFPISLAMRLFGGSRAVFVFSAANLYLLPSLLGLCALGRRRKWGGVALALLFPGLVYLTLVGYVDVAACGAAVWAVYFYVNQEAPGWARGVLAGALLTLSFLLRRYFIFFALSFGAAALVRGAVSQKRSPAAFGALFGMAAVTSLYGAQAFLVDKLTTNYGDLYSAYELGLRSDIMLFCRYFGFVILALALVRGVWLLVRRNGDAVFALVQLLACFFLVTRVQSHGQQHTLMYLPALALLLSPGERSAAPRWQSAVAWALAAATGLVPLLPRPQPASIAEIRFPDPLPGFSYHGPRRSDIGELVALADYLDSLSDGDTTAAVCASSFLLTGETLTSLRPSLNLPEPETGIRYLYMTSVDKRDGFSWNVLDADYLVVGDPVQVHLGEENQQVVALLAHAVLDGTGVGTAYEKLPVSYTLQDGAQVYVYRRTREVTAAERESIAQALREKYPDYAWLYQVP